LKKETRISGVKTAPWLFVKKKQPPSGIENPDVAGKGIFFLKKNPAL